MRVQQQPAPREEAVGGQHADIGKGVGASWLEVNHHLLRVDHQTVLWNAGQQNAAKKHVCVMRSLKIEASASLHVKSVNGKEWHCDFRHWIVGQTEEKIHNLLLFSRGNKTFHALCSSLILKQHTKDVRAKR